MSAKLQELEHLINTLPPGKIINATRDLHFSWGEISKLLPGQMDVLLKRLRRASAKTLEDYDEAAETSEHIQSMRVSLAKFMENTNLLRDLLAAGLVKPEDYHDRSQ